MEVAQTSSEISVSQRKYVFFLLEETGMLKCRPTDTPMEQNSKLSDGEEIPPVDNGQHQRLVAKLIYLSHTRTMAKTCDTEVEDFNQVSNENVL
ncbi:hypothetical protein CK203_029164 [Vitis vinifera]|uniref:Retrovirus-related Pol polyprotein from transposon RE1 n=1 Tax=Vitis vinifera TaxID=29760 RepID=A0A438ISX6_VITVI|nr:hypothetical protein CK203_029164 [Vitis vinifera]